MSFDFLQVFHVEVHTELWTWPFIRTGEVDCSKTFNHDWAQVFSYSKYSLLILPVVGIEPAASRWFHTVAPSNQMPWFK